MISYVMCTTVYISLFAMDKHQLTRGHHLSYTFSIILQEPHAAVAKPIESFTNVLQAVSPGKDSNDEDSYDEDSYDMDSYMMKTLMMRNLRPLMLTDADEGGDV